MTPEEQARQLADHCRYCGMPDYRPKCKSDYESLVRGIAGALAEKDKEIRALTEKLGRAVDLCEHLKQDQIHFARYSHRLEAEIAKLEKGE